MHPETLTFLQALCGSAQGFITLTAVHPNKKRSAPSRHVQLNDDVALKKALDDLYMANARGWGAYVSIATRKSDLGRWRRGGYDDLLLLPALFVDIDREPEKAINKLHNFSPLPSCIVRSGHGIHVYWFLTQPTSQFDLVNRILRGLAACVDGDKTNAAQMLRLPGTINTKPTRAGLRCHVVELYPERRSLLSDFAQFEAVSSLKQSTSIIKEVGRLTFNHELNLTLVMGIADCLLSEYHGHVKANGYIAALCPCGHCHDYPGSHFNFDMSRAIGTCFGRHGRLLLKDLCDLLKLNPEEYGGLYG